MSDVVDPVDPEGLVEAARGGDPDAWETLYRRVYPRLRSYVASRVGAGDAEDLVSETMTRAVAAIDRFRWEPAGFDGWIFGIARRVTADHNRRSARRLAQPVVSLDRSAEGDDHAAGLERSAEHARLRDALARLSDDDRELLELRAVGQLSFEDVARVLGKRPGAVRTASSRAVARLRAIVAELEGEEVRRG